MGTPGSNRKLSSQSLNMGLCFLESTRAEGGRFWYGSQTSSNILRHPQTSSDTLPPAVCPDSISASLPLCPCWLMVARRVWHIQARQSGRGTRKPFTRRHGISQKLLGGLHWFVSHRPGSVPGLKGGCKAPFISSVLWWQKSRGQSLGMVVGVANHRRKNHNIN